MTRAERRRRGGRARRGTLLCRPGSAAAIAKGSPMSSRCSCGSNPLSRRVLSREA